MRMLRGQYPLRLSQPPARGGKRLPRGLAPGFVSHREMRRVWGGGGPLLLSDVGPIGGRPNRTPEAQDDKPLHLAPCSFVRCVFGNCRKLPHGASK